MIKNSIKKVIKNKAPVAKPKKMRISNVSGSGLEIILKMFGDWEHFWLNPGDVISIERVPLSQTATTLLQNRLIEVTDEI
jgi:hypothetical protein